MQNVAQAFLSALLLLGCTQTVTGATGVEIAQDRKASLADRLAAATKNAEEGRREYCGFESFPPNRAVANPP